MSSLIAKVKKSHSIEGDQSLPLFQDTGLPQALGRASKRGIRVQSYLENALPAYQWVCITRCFRGEKKVAFYCIKALGAFFCVFEKMKSKSK